MDQENYVEGCSMQRPPLLEPNGFCFWKARFETYIKSKDIDLWQVIQNGDFVFEMEDPETKMTKDKPYELLEDDENKQLGKNNEAKRILYNALPRKEYERVFMCKTAKEFSISNEETIDSGFTRFNAIMTSLKSLDLNYFSKNHVRKFLRALLLKWRAKVTAIKEAKDLATLPLDELVGNKVYKMILENDGVVSKNITKEKVNDEDVDEEEAESFNLMAKNFCKFFGKGACYNYGIEDHFASECKKPKENKAFVGGAWSDSEDGDEPHDDATCHMAIDSQEVVSKPSNSNYDLNIIDLQKENEELLRFNKDFAKTFE
ncbi:hypothetical protein Tco_0196545 [Tanacetum coccineum]